MGVDSFQPLSSLALQLCATLPFDTSAVSVDCLLLRRSIDPTLRAAIRLRNIGPNPGLLDLPHHFPAVIPLVGHDFHGSIRVHHLSLNRFIHGFGDNTDVLACSLQRFLHRLRISGIRWLHGHRNHRPRFHVHGMLGLMR
jgi:hypothetical protein